jgi:hypothetical protein
LEKCDNVRGGAREQQRWSDPLLTNGMVGHYYWNRVSHTGMPFVRMFPRTFDYPRLISGGPVFPDEKWIKSSSEGCERMWLILNMEDPGLASDLRRMVNSYYVSVPSEKEFSGIKVILYENRSGSAGLIHDLTDSAAMLSDCSGLAFGTAGSPWPKSGLRESCLRHYWGLL